MSNSLSVITYIGRFLKDHSSFFGSWRKVKRDPHLQVKHILLNRWRMSKKAYMSCAVYFMTRLWRRLYETSRLSLVCWFLPIGHQSLLRCIIDFPNNFLSHVMSQRSEWRELCSNSFWLTSERYSPESTCGRITTLTSYLMNDVKTWATILISDYTGTRNEMIRWLTNRPTSVRHRDALTHSQLILKKKKHETLLTCKSIETSIARSQSKRISSRNSDITNDFSLRQRIFLS